MHINESEHKNSTVVYVTDQFKCENLIKAGKKIAEETATSLFVVNVCAGNFGKDDMPDLDALEFLYQKSNEYGAIMNVFYETNVIDILQKTAKDYHAEHIITGIPQSSGSVLDKFWGVDAHVSFYMVDDDGEVTSIPQKSQDTLIRN